MYRRRYPRPRANSRSSGPSGTEPFFHSARDSDQYVFLFCVPAARLRFTERNANNVRASSCRCDDRPDYFDSRSPGGHGINAGNHTINASFAADGNFGASSNTGTLTVVQASATIALSNLAQTYDGTVKSATATTSPTGKAVVFSYNQNGQPVVSPTSAGSYDFTATINDVNYQGSTTGILVIGKASATITLGNLTPTYDGTAKSATATTNPLGLSGISITYNLSGTSPTNAGSYNVLATLTNANYQASIASGTLTIGPTSSTTTVSVSNATYDGLPHGGTATATGAGGLNQSLTVNYTGRNGTIYSSSTSPTNAGDYTASASFLGDNNHTPSNSNADFQIAKATAMIILGNLTPIYDGAGKSATATTNPAGKTVAFSYNQNGQPVASPTNVGSYNVSATINDANYQGSTTGILVIGKASVTITLGNLTATYDGTAKSATVTTNPAGKTVAFSYSQNGQPVASPTNAGSYDVTATINDANYQGSTTGIFVIGKASATIVLSNLSQSYDGNPKTATATTTPLGLSGVALTYNQSATPPTNAGSYDINATLTNNNYQASNAAGVLVINKGTATITFSNVTQFYDGTPKSVTASTTPAGLSMTITYSPVSSPTNVGSYTVSATINDANYQGTATGTLVIVPFLFLDPATNQAIAIDSVTFVGSPFPIITTHNFSADQHTRIMIFTSNLGLNQSAPVDPSVLTVQAGGVTLNIENVGTLPGGAGVASLNPPSYIIVRLSDDLPHPADVMLTITFHGVTSNAGVISISP